MNPRELAVQFLRKNMVIITRAFQEKRFKFQDAKTPLETAYSGAPHFKLIDANTYEYETLPNISRAQAILSLMASGQLLMTCQSAQSLAIYATILDVLMECKGNETGSSIFDKVFPQIYLRNKDIYAGASISFQSFSCILENSTARQHPLLYFFMAADNSILNITRPQGQHLIEPGMMTYFDNHPLHRLCAEFDPTHSRRIAVVCTRKTATETLYMAYGINEEVNETQILTELLRSLNAALNAQPNSIFKQMFQLTHNDIPGFNTHYLRHINYDALTRLVAQPEKEIKAMQEWIAYENEMIALIRAAQKRFDEQTGTQGEKKALLLSKLKNSESLLQKLQASGKPENLPLFIRILLEQIITLYISINYRGESDEGDYEMMARLHQSVATAYVDNKLYVPAIRHLELGLNYAYALHITNESSREFNAINAELALFRKIYYGIELPAVERVTHPESRSHAPVTKSPSSY